MKKKRNILIIFLLIIVALWVVLYSFDFFTSKANTANLIIKTGKLSLEVHNDDKWNISNEHNISESKYEAYKNNFINAKPGDVFLKKIIIKNTGTLKQNLNFICNTKIPAEIKEMFNIEIIGIDNKKITLAPKQNKDIIIKLTLKNDKVNNIYQNKNINFQQLQIFNFLIVEGNQVKI